MMDNITSLLSQVIVTTRMKLHNTARTPSIQKAQNIQLRPLTSNKRKVKIIRSHRSMLNLKTTWTK